MNYFEIHLYIDHILTYFDEPQEVQLGHSPWNTIDLVGILNVQSRWSFFLHKKHRGIHKSNQYNLLRRHHNYLCQIFRYRVFLQCCNLENQDNRCHFSSKQQYTFSAIPSLKGYILLVLEMLFCYQTRLLRISENYKIVLT